MGQSTGGHLHRQGPGHLGRRALLGLSITLVTLALAPTASADHSEADVKAAFVYNFAKFIEWPASSLASANALQLCVLGDDALEGKLGMLQGRTAQGHEIHVRTLSSMKDWAGCHILYLGTTSDSQRRQVLAALGNATVLTVSDTPDFAQQGGMIGLWVEASRVQFAINLDQAQQAGLKVSARMLQLAHVVREASK